MGAASCRADPSPEGTTTMTLSYHRSPTAHERLERGSDGPATGASLVDHRDDGRLRRQRQATTAAIAEMWEDVGVTAVVEVIDPAARHQKIRQQGFKGVWWSDPTSLLRDPDWHDGKASEPRPDALTTGGIREFDRLAVEARIQRRRGPAGATPTGG